MSPAGVRGLLFDVFGTCVDWRSGVIREGEALGRRLGLGDVDWPGLADAWRGRYQPQLETVRSGARPWVDLDVLHREALDELLPRFGLAGLPDHERRELTRAWHRLDGWPDAVEGLTRLKRRFAIAPCSNGHIALVVAMARHAGLPWDAILGAEIARAYKPQPEVYEASVKALGLEPREAMMVAAHPGDLEAAAACGLGTAYVHRPGEYGPGGSPEPPPGEGAVDLRAGDLIELAGLLGA
jgi:2-haloacid dehalogenase